jgi:hypothetical protein
MRRELLALLFTSSSGLALACGSTSTPVSPSSIVSESTALVSGQPAERCVNVFAEGTASLGLVTLPNGTTGFGGNWSPVSLGGISGEMASVVLNQETAGQGQQGALHLTLEHAFETPNGDYFITQDRAVCAPAGPEPLRCRVNDVLTIVGGTGMFENANGSLRNHGTVDFVQGTLDFSMRGRMCGDGL